jgi:hypothetical protein
MPGRRSAADTAEAASSADTMRVHFATRKILLLDRKTPGFIPDAPKTIV